MTQILFSLSTHTPFAIPKVLRCFFPWLSPLILPCEKNTTCHGLLDGEASGGYKYVMLMLCKYTFPVSERAFFQVRNSLFSCQKQPLFMSKTTFFHVRNGHVCRNAELRHHLFADSIISFRELLKSFSARSCSMFMCIRYLQ